MLMRSVRSEPVVGAIVLSLVAAILTYSDPSGIIVGIEAILLLAISAQILYSIVRNSAVRAVNADEIGRVYARRTRAFRWAIVLIIVAAVLILSSAWFAATGHQYSIVGAVVGACSVVAAILTLRSCAALSPADDLISRS